MGIPGDEKQMCSCFRHVLSTSICIPNIAYGPRALEPAPIGVRLWIPLQVSGKVGRDLRLSLLVYHGSGAVRSRALKCQIGRGTSLCPWCEAPIAVAIVAGEVGQSRPVVV